MIRKIISEGTECQQKFLRGVNVVDKMVGNTLGPGGRNRMIPEKYRAPMVINDGAEIARRIFLEDPVEDVAAQAMIELSMKTAEQAGDGTTTSVVIGSELVRTCIDLLVQEGSRSALVGGERTSAMKLWRDIQTDREKATTLLKEQAKELKDKDLDNIISTSLENHTYGKELGQLLRTVGHDGYISVEDNWATKYGITTELTTGMRFLGKYATPYLATSTNKKEALWQETHILVTNHQMDSVAAIANLLKQLGEKGHRKLVIINGYSEGENGYSKEFVETVARAMQSLADPRTTNKDQIIQALAVRAPSLTTPELQDVAEFCGAMFVDKNLGMELSTVELAHLGYAQKVSVTEDEVNIVGGKGKPQERIKTLKEQLDLEKDQMFKEKLLRRIAALSSGVGIIRVGAQTESERTYLKEKLKDAVSAAKAAMAEGYVPGGGMSFKKVADKLGKDSILYRALNAPHDRIKSNMGVEKLDTPKNIINPLKVDRLALENACSGAGMIITSDGAIVEERLTYGDWLEKALQKQFAALDQSSDFRAEENRDYGKGSVVN